MRLLSRILVLLSLLLLFSNVVFAIGISPSKYTINFVPNFEGEFRFVVSDTDDTTNIKLSVDGDLAEYVTLSKDLVRHQDDHAFTAYLKLPPKVEKPGKNRILIRAELSPTGAGGGGISAIGAVQAPIDVIVPYPGKYLDYSFTVRDVNEGEPVLFTLYITNLGTDTVNQVSVTFDVYDSENNKKDTLTTEKVALISKGSHGFERELNTLGYRPGSYKVIATIFHDDGEEVIERTFRIGTLQVNIVNYTREFLVDTINRFELKADSKWNSLIEEVYANIDVSKNGVRINSFKTFEVSLNPWETKVLDGFYDTNGMELGEYDANITIYYEDKTATELGKFVIKKARHFELPTGFSITALLIIIILVIIIADIFWMVHKHKKEDNESKGNKTEDRKKKKDEEK